MHEPSEEFLRSFYLNPNSIDSLNMSHPVIIEYIQRLIIAFNEEYKAYLDIIEIIGVQKIPVDDENVDLANQRQIQMNSQINMDRKSPRRDLKYFGFSTLVE